MGSELWRPLDEAQAFLSLLQVQPPPSASRMHLASGLSCCSKCPQGQGTATQILRETQTAGPGSWAPG